ncbi:hypothetical protein AYI68_g6299 [Smittium mucronatum]|uniref:Uncharacterized protein n=1 Tax=Smittium mucronatum TaxID=133383 RepID=A0A1R0GRX6_9FUNG|nr:hypothetical protein AYI68_g6299 [Smittium mucronatum]
MWPQRGPHRHDICRSCIDNFTELAAPLYTLLQKENEFNWDTNCDTFFQKSNFAMTSVPILAHPGTFSKFHRYIHGTCTELHVDHLEPITALNNEDPRG